MIKSLNVYFDTKLAGTFEQDQSGKHSFTYNQTYLNSAEARPISQIMPLSNEKYGAKVCHAFFAGILPEDAQRRMIARYLGISPGNDFSMLEKIGGECAGAICILPSDASFKSQDYKYQELSTLDLTAILNELPTRPLLAGEHGVRISLAGVQDKLAVAIFDHKIYLPLNGAASTHILKPRIPGYEFSTVINEGFCLQLAKQIGMRVADCEFGNTEDHSYLLVKRFDRILEENFKIKRLHQEDFCQALGIAPEQKYQNEGGPSLTACFQLVRDVSDGVIFDVPRLLDAIVFNYIVGNCDAHGKNFSLLYRGKRTQLAPLYDILSTLIYPKLSTKMAMKIGKEYNINQIQKKHFVKLAEDNELNVPLTMQRIVELCELIVKNLSMPDFTGGNVETLQSFINQRAKDLIAKINCAIPHA